MKENNGWVKLHRKITKWEWYENLDTRLVFLHLLVTANHQSTSWKNTKIEPGERVFGRIKLAKEIGISEQRLRTALHNLQLTSELTIKSTNKFSLVHLNNWFNYQDKKPADQPITNQQTNQQPTTSKEYIRNKEEKNIYISPEKIKEIAEKYSVEVKSVESVYEDLVLYCKSKGKRYANYEAALMNWVRTSLKQGKIKVVNVTPMVKIEDITEDQRVKNLERLNEIRQRFSNKLHLR